MVDAVGPPSGLAVEECLIYFLNKPDPDSQGLIKGRDHTGCTGVEPVSGMVPSGIGFHFWSSLDRLRTCFLGLMAPTLRHIPPSNVLQSPAQ